jgi:hypothetical protein
MGLGCKMNNSINIVFIKNIVDEILTRNITMNKLISGTSNYIGIRCAIIQAINIKYIDIRIMF